MKRSGKASKAVIILLAATIALAGSTAYLASGGSRQKPSSSGTYYGEVLYKLQPYNVTGVDPNATVGSSLNSIAVSASGQASYVPDEALVQVTVVVQNSTAEEATQSDAQRTASVIDSLEAMGISNGSIETQGYSLSADYAGCYSSCIPSIVGYTVSNSLQVNVTGGDAKTLGLTAGKVIDAAVKAGADQVSLYFGATQSQVDRVTAVALKNAVGSADDQAQTIATSLGVSITGVISATEGGGYLPQPYYGSAVNAASLAADVASTPIMPGTQSYSVTVQVVYSI